MSSAASSSECDGTEEDTLRKHIMHLKREGTQWTGFVESKTSLQALTRDFAAMNVSYTTESSHYKSEEQQRKAKLMFSASKGAVPISLTAPFRVLSSVHKGCIFGKDRHNVQSQQEQKEFIFHEVAVSAPDFEGQHDDMRAFELAIRRRRAERREQEAKRDTESPKDCHPGCIYTLPFTPPPPTFFFSFLPVLAAEILLY